MQARLAETIFRLLSLFPLSVTYKLGSIIGWLAYALPNSLKRPLKTNIDLCFPDLSKAERAALCKKSFLEMCRTLTESGAVWTWNKDKLLGQVKNVSGSELLAPAFDKGKGVILAMPHLGSWEMMSLYCSQLYPTTSLYRPLRLDGLNPFIKSARERFGASLAPTNASGIRLLYKALEKNQLVAILPDQDPGNEGSVFAPFCGISASTMTLLPRLIHKTGATLIYGYAERLPDGKGYHIHFLPDSRDYQHADLQLAASQLNQGVETCVRKIPEQYQWAYKRFKTRPEGEPRLY